MERHCRQGVRLKPLHMAFIGMGLAFFYMGQTLHFIFEADDLRFLWWANQNLSSPWAAFYDEPLFGQYYRPIVSVVWWLHVRLFGLHHAYHQWMVGMWWAASVLLLFQLSRSTKSPLAGFLSMLMLMCMYAGVNPLVWKSWLTTICSVVFQLAALLVLLRCVCGFTYIRLLLWALFSVMAFLSKESAIFCLPATSFVLIAFASTISLRLRFALLSTLIGMTCVVIYCSPSLRSITEMGMSKTAHLAHSYLFAAYYSGAVWTSYPLQAIGFLLIAVTTYHARSLRLACSLAIGAVASCVGIWMYVNEISFFESTSCALMVWINVLWVSRQWRIVSIPLIWIAVSFWPLTVLQERCIPYAFNASISLAWLLGAGLQPVLVQSFVKLKDDKWLARTNASLFILVLLICMIVAMNKNYKQFNQWVHYAETVFHGPERQVREAAVYDLAARAWDGPVYIQVGDRLGLETFLALAAPERFDIPVLVQPPPDGAYRLEAHSESVYSIYPKSQAHDIWVSSPNPPADRVLHDPYYVPERWRREPITLCDDASGWEGAEQMSVVGFPIGQGAHIQTRFDRLPWRFEYMGSKPIESQSDEWLIEFWLETRRWDWVDSVEVKFNLIGQTYIWNDAPLKRWGLASDWRRVLISPEDAEIVEEQGESQFIIELKPRAGIGPPPLAIGIDNVAVYWRKNEIEE